MMFHNRSGSVIADYTVSASAINPEELVNARSSIVAQLGKRFKIITDSKLMYFDMYCILTYKLYNLQAIRNPTLNAFSISVSKFSGI